MRHMSTSSLSLSEKKSLAGFQVSSNVDKATIRFLAYYAEIHMFKIEKSKEKGEQLPSRRGQCSQCTWGAFVGRVWAMGQTAQHHSQT